MTLMYCPYCYNKISRPLAFQCRGIGTPGRPGCPPVQDEMRMQLTGFRAPTHPVFPAPGPGLWTRRRADCPGCGGVTGTRACPDCHTPLPAHFGEADSPMIAMVGASGTGKTVLLTVLANDLRHAMSERFDAAVGLAAVGQGGENSPLNWLKANVEKLFNDWTLADQTPSAARTQNRREPLVFEWRKRHRRAWPMRRYRTSYLSFYDTAGEDVAAGARVANLAYFGAARALILLLDPFMLPEARDRIYLPDEALKSEDATVDVVKNLTEALRECHGVSRNNKIKVPVAVAFAKIDAFFDILTEGDPIRLAPDITGEYDEMRGHATHEYVRSLLHEWGGHSIDKLFAENYDVYRYFAVSALGHQPDYKRGTVREGVIRPHRIDEPLIWLLSRFRVVPVRRDA